MTRASDGLISLPEVEQEMAGRSEARRGCSSVKREEEERKIFLSAGVL